MIEFRGVTFRYNGAAILRGVDLRVAEGGFYFLTGPSGAGKTTFLKLCHLVLRPSEGQIRVAGRDVASVAGDAAAILRRRIGMVFQDCPFLDHMSVRENVALPLRIAGRRPESYAADVDELIGWVGLENRQHARPPELSGGERQRAALARAVIAGPDLVLADEPTGNVEWEMAERILDLFAALNRAGRTVLVATHDLELIRAAKRRAPCKVMRLAEGRVIEAGAGL